jgi:hydrogenase-4 component B
MYGQELFPLLISVSLAGALLSIVTRKWERFCRTAPFIAAAAASVIGLAIAIEVLLMGGEVSLTIPTAVAALGHFTFIVDRLSAFFMLAISALGLCVSIYSIGYTQEYAGRYSPASSWSSPPPTPSCSSSCGRPCP